MTVKNLIEFLQKYPTDLEVVVSAEPRLSEYTIEEFFDGQKRVVLWISEEEDIPLKHEE